jgi:hypothetical protein
MSEPTHKQASPAIAFLKKNAVVVVLAGALVAGVGVYAVNAAQPERTAVSAPVPSIHSTASLAGGPMVAATATASPGASGASGATGAPSAAAGAYGGSQAGAGSDGVSAGQPAASTAAPTSPARPQTTVTVGTAAQAPTIKDWRPVAEAFSKAFVNPSVGKDAWLAAIKPYCTPALFEQYKVVDITRIPQDNLKYVNELRHSERTYVFSPNLASGKNIFTATADIQDSTGTWLVGHVGGPE